MRGMWDVRHTVQRIDGSGSFVLFRGLREEGQRMSNPFRELASENIGIPSI
ncbi:MAG TPA: hypothetical protein VKM94_23915 [Blastocatellia bacterium]|nr:hypothetical protein [Blastocatellia bacterium]